MDSERVKQDSFDTMWAFLQMGNQKASPEILKEYCEKLRHMMMQKTAGQRKNRPDDVQFEHMEVILNAIVIEAMALYLSGTLDSLINEQNAQEQ